MKGDRFYGIAVNYSFAEILPFVKMKSNKNKKNSEQADIIRGPLKKPSLAERQYSEPVAVDHVDRAGFSRSQSTPETVLEERSFNPDILSDGICISPQRVAPRHQDTSHSAVRDAEVRFCLSPYEIAFLCRSIGTKVISNTTLDVMTSSAIFKGLKCGNPDLVIYDSINPNLTGVDRFSFRASATDGPDLDQEYLTIMQVK